ncbi:MAG: DUF4326 domain-containing protein [Anaerolineaceae bacterium]|jgi:hypothetical protein
MSIVIENKRSYQGEGYYVGRPSVLGNPFPMKSEEDRAEVIAKYRVWLWDEIKKGGVVAQELNHLAAEYRLKGSLTLICWCHPKPCHAEVISTAVKWLAEK